MNVRLPDVPEPTEVEIELTNACNAVCTACPRNNLEAPKGVMKAEVFHNIIDQYVDWRPDLAINRLRGTQDFPFITLAGLGEPLLHREAIDFIAYSAKRRFRTVLFTNISRLDVNKADRLLDSGVTDVYVSFWGIEKSEYEAAMKLDFERSLRNLEYFATRARHRGIKVLVTWVNVPQLRSTNEEIKAFWQARGIQVDTEDDAPENRSASNSVWNRGGALETIPQAALHSAVNFKKEFWCSQLYFADTYCWNGDAILCSQDYFRKEVVLGNCMTMNPQGLAAVKADLFRSRMQKPICARCLKQRDYSIATHPWDAMLPIEELRRYRYDVA